MVSLSKCATDHPNNAANNGIGLNRTMNSAVWRRQVPIETRSVRAREQ